MTNVLPLLPDDLAPGLRPLDFSNLLPFPNDPVLPVGSTASPSQPPWPAIPLFSPLCSVNPRLVSGPPADLLPDNSPWLSNLSPLFKHVTEKDNDFSASLFQNIKLADFPPDWGSTIATDIPTATDPTFSASNLTFTASSAATNLDDVHSPAFAPTPTDATLSDQPGPLQQAADAILAGFPLAGQTAESQPMDCDKPVHDAAVLPEVDVQTVLSPSLAMSAQTVTTSPRTGDTQSFTGGSHSSEAKSASVQRGKRGSPSTRKASQMMSSIDKAAERRRKNRESSSRCYYNRKRIIESLDKQISAEKTRLTSLYDRALELRHENARLKKDVVTRGIPLPTKPRMMRRLEPVGTGFGGYVGMMSRKSYGK